MTGRPAGITLSLVRDIVASVISGERGSATPPAYLSVTFLFAPAMRRLNREWLGHDCPTDVLSFCLTHPDGGTSGDVYICPTVAVAAARYLLWISFQRARSGTLALARWRRRTLLGEL